MAKNVITDQGYVNPDLVSEEMRKFVAERRKGRTVVEVRIPRGLMKYGGYSYGLRVRGDGRIFRITNSGADSQNREWHFSAGSSLCLWKKGNKVIEVPEFIPNLLVKVNHPTVGRMSAVVALDVERMPDEGKDWVWRIYLPKRHWSVSGGSTFWMPDHPAKQGARVKELAPLSESVLTVEE